MVRRTKSASATLGVTLFSVVHTDGSKASETLLIALLQLFVPSAPFLLPVCVAVVWVVVHCLQLAN
jgi:hypothetical protein